MNAPSSCPDEKMFRDFVAGLLPDAATQSIRHHLNSCHLCLRALDSLKSEGMACQFESSESEETISDKTRTAYRQGSEEPSPDEEYTLDLSFLDVPTQDRSLGRIGEYEVLYALGEGGMGVVFKAFDKTLHRMVAIKVLTPRLASSQGARRRFIREARAAAAINHPNVITIHSVSVQKEMPYLVMEYIAGSSLHHRIKGGPPLETEEVLRIGVQVASGLAAAHEQGVIHRDIKPANIMLEDGVERVKITDFGLALAAMDSSQITSAGQMVGTPAYMSPEQVSSSGLVDPRSDLFSLGCVLYAMFTGHSPFKGKHTIEVIHNVCDNQPAPLHEVCPKVPPELSEVVRRLLEKNPKDRYQSASELEVVLKQQLATANTAKSGESHERVAARRGPRARPTRRRVLTFVSAAPLLLALCGWAWWSSGPERPLALDRARPLDLAREVVKQGKSAPPVVPIPGRLITVARSGPADYRMLGEALSHAEPGTTIRITDDATYNEGLRIDEDDRLSDLTIESARRATISAPLNDPVVVTIEGTVGVTIRGVTIKASARQHGVVVTGKVEGLRLEDIRIVQPAQSMKAVIYIHAGTSGTPQRPIVLHGLDINCGTLGIGIFGEEDKPTSWIRLENSRVVGAVVLLLLDTAVTDVTITRNVFARGRNGMNLNLNRAGQSRNITVCQNTFYGMKFWMGLAETILDQGKIDIRRNLILESTAIEVIGQDLEQVAKAWFAENVWELSSAIDEPQARLVAELRDEVPLLSTEPASTEFLVPVPGSGITAGAAGGECPPRVSGPDPTP